MPATALLNLCPDQLCRARAGPSSGSAFALVLVAGAVIVVDRLRGSRPDRNRVAVAVFVNRTGDPSLEPLGNMAADWVTRGLTQTALVDVVDLGALYVEGRSAAGVPTDPLRAGPPQRGRDGRSGELLCRHRHAGRAGDGGGRGERHRAPDGDPRPRARGRRRAGAGCAAGPRDGGDRGSVRRAVWIGVGAPVRSARASPLTEPSSTDRPAYWQGRPQDKVKALFERAAAEDTTFVGPAVWLAFLGANGSGCALTDSVTNRSLRGAIG